MNAITTTTTPLAPVVVRSVDQHAASVYLAGLSSPESRRTMRQALDTIAALLTDARLDALALDWSAVRFSHTAAIRSKLAERYSPATTNKMLAALRGVLKTAWKLEQVSAEDFHRAAEIPGVKGSTLPRGRAVPPKELLALLDACANDKTPAGFRDAAILAVMFGAGLRRAEIAALDVDDLDIPAGTVTVRQGKGRKARVGHLVGGAAARLRAWLAVRGDDAGPLFVPVNQVREITIRRMTAQSVYNALAKRSRLAGVRDVSPHDGRRSYISNLLDAGADLSVVQQLAGHSNIATTARYDRRGEEAKARAVALVSLPGTFTGAL